MVRLQKAILKTLAYADVFDYPLNSEEFHSFLIADKAVSFPLFGKALSRIKANDKRVETKGEFFFFKGRKKLVSVRKRREKWSQKKMKIALRVARWLKIIPWVKMVGITGALAMKNSSKDDDIDFLIVTSKNRLWLTRLVVVFLTELLTRRRRPKDKKVKDKICLNMFLAENCLALPAKERDLFSAHEVAQFQLLWDKDGIYSQFLKKNQWVEKYLPNWLEGREMRRQKSEKSKKASPLFNSLERLVYCFQLIYMKPRRTTEVTVSGRILFHPQDARGWVLKKYQQRLKKLGLPF